MTMFPSLPAAVTTFDQPTVILVAVLGSAGVVLLIAGWFGVLPAMQKSTKTASSSSLGTTSLRAVLAAAGGLIPFVVTGWPVLAFFCALGGWFSVTLKQAKRERREAIERVDAIATWVETVRDNISGAAGLQQALRNSGNHVPESIRPEVRDLVLRLQHEAVVPTLRRFAADVAHPTADMAVGCLILASSRSAGSLTDVLANTAQAARDSASMLRQIEAGRVQSQSQAKLVGLIAGSMSVYMILSGGDFVEPYDTFIGQVALFAICGLVAGSVGALYRLSKPVPQQRVFRGVESSGGAEPATVPVEVN